MKYLHFSNLKNPNQKALVPSNQFLVPHLRSHVQLHNRQHKEHNAQPDARFKHHTLGTSALDYHRSASAKGCAQSRRTVLDQNRQAQEDTNQDVKGEEEGHFVNREVLEMYFS